MAFVTEADADRALSVLKRHAVSEQACSIGAVGYEADRLDDDHLFGPDPRRRPPERRAASKNLPVPHEPGGGGTTVRVGHARLCSSSRGALPWRVRPGRSRRRPGPASEVVDRRTPVADRIRERIQKAGGRFHANDNIAAFIEEGELEQLRLEVAGKIDEVLQALVIDTESDHNTQDTARRVAKMYLMEVFAGRYVTQPPVTEFPNVRRLNELMIVGPVTVRSACSHHLCPIIGRIWVGVMPNEHSALIGLSKYARLVEWVMTRPQIQEEAIAQLAELLQDKMQPDGLAIVMEADHYCMQWRGVKDMDSKMTNSIMRGSFLKNPDLRREFLSLLTRMKD